MKYYKILDSFLKKNPGYNLALFVLIMGLIQLVMNIIRHKSILHNMEGIYLLAGMYAIAWMLSKLEKSKALILLIAYAMSFLMLCFLLFVDGSYYDYTSFIIMGIIAVFVMLVIMGTITRIKGSKKG